MKLLATLQRSGGIEGLARQVKQPVERVNPLCEGLLPPLMLAMRGYVRRNGGGMVGAQALLDVIDSRGDGALAADVLSDGEANAASGESLLSLYFVQHEDRDRSIARFLDVSAVDPVLLDRLFALLAMLVSGLMAAQVGGSGAAGSGGLQSLGDILAFLVSDDADEDCQLAIDPDGN